VNTETHTVVHVAEAGENRGRVVLRLTTADPNRIAVEAAVRIARAYQSGLESIFIEDQRLIDVAAHPLIAEISLCGRERRRLSPVSLVRQLAHAARTAERQISRVARLADIPYTARTIRDEPVHAINRACAEAGPWNVVVLADAIHARDSGTVLDLLADVEGATGLVLVGPKACRAHGPILIALEDVERLPQMLRAAERLAAETGEAIVLLLAGATDDAMAGMEFHARLLLEDRSDVTVQAAGPCFGHPGGLVEALRRGHGGIVIGQIGGALLPRTGHWSDLSRTLECPVFVVR
jgi:hypothetical protein